MNEPIWPGPDDKLVVTEMIQNPDSPHWKQCYIWVSRLVGQADISENLREDIVQEAMVSITRGLPGFHFNSRLTTWLTTVTGNRKKDAFRRQSKQIRQAETLLDELQSPADNGESLEFTTLLTTEEEVILREELHDALHGLQEVLEHRSDRDKAIILMRLLDERKYSEIAKSFGIREQKVMYLCKNIQKLLRKVCQRQPPG